MSGDETALRELLHRAAPDLGSLVPPPEVTPPRRARRSTFIAVAAAAAAVAAVAIAVGLIRQPAPADHRRSAVAPGERSPTQSTSATRQITAGHPLTVQIRLDRTTVAAGRPINGVAIVTNASGHPLTIADCNGAWLQVGLSNARIRYSPAWLDCLSVPGTVLRPGTTRIPITVRTTYDSCTQRASSATDGLPACQRGPHGETSMPPLPPGNYRTATGILDPDGLHVPTPEPVQVTLTPINR
jgi:hypothetical protein